MPGEEQDPAPRRPGRPRKEERRRTVQSVTVQLPPALVEELDTEAGRQDLDSRSEVIRRACLEYLRRQEKRRSRGDGADTL